MKVKKFRTILLVCFLIISLASIGFAEDQKQTKKIYRGSKHRPTIIIEFFDSPELGTGWSAQIVEYKIRGRIRYVGDQKYLTEEQRLNENTAIVKMGHIFKSPELIDIDYTFVTVINPLYDDMQEQWLYLHAHFFDVTSDWRPDVNEYGWLPASYHQRRYMTFGSSYDGNILGFHDEIKKIDIKLFKKVKKHLGSTKIEKEFQEWLKENKQ